MSFNGIQEIIQNYGSDSDSEEDIQHSTQTTFEGSVNKLLLAITNTTTVSNDNEMENSTVDSFMDENIDSIDIEQEEANNENTNNNSGLQLLADLVIGNAEKQEQNINNNNNQSNINTTEPEKLSKGQMIILHNKQLAKNLNNARKKVPQMRSSSTNNENESTATGRDGAGKGNKNKKRLSYSDSEIRDESDTDKPNPPKKRKTISKRNNNSNINKTITKSRVKDIETKFIKLANDTGAQLHYASTLSLDELVAYEETKPSECMCELFKLIKFFEILVCNVFFQNTNDIIGSYNFRSSTLKKSKNRRNKKRKENTVPITPKKKVNKLKEQVRE